MKKISFTGLLFLLFLVMHLATIAQPKFIPDALKTKLQGKTKLPDIMKEVDAYYDEQQNSATNPNKNGPKLEEEGKAYTHWKRWEWWMSSHLDANGNFVNYRIKNAEALNENDRKWNNEINSTLRRVNTPKKTATEREQASANALLDEGEGTEAAFGDWTVIGPTAEGTTSDGDIKGLGRFDRIAFHPSNASIFYVGSPTGNLWKTSDGGSSWASVTDGLANPGIAGIAISPTNGNTIYILTGDGDSYTPGFLVYDFGSSRASSGVYKSTDGGASWSKMGDLYTGGDYEGHKLSISPTNGNYLFATTSQGIYRTTNGGTSWTLVRSGEHWDVEFKTSTDSTVYATTGGSILYSTQGGRSGTWNTATTDFSVAASGRIELAVTAANNSYVYAVCGNAAVGSYTGTFRSTNSGVSFTRRSNTPNILGSEENGLDDNDQSGYDLDIAAKPTDANYVATCGLNVWVSNGSNGASSMVWSTKYREGYAGAANKYIHPDVHAVAYNPINNWLYACSDGGVYRSTDDGTSWTNLSAGLITTQFYSMAMRDSDADGDADGLGLIGGAQDNGIKLRPASGSTVFDHVICCDGYGVAINSDNPDLLYYNINRSFYRSTNGGTTNTFVIGGTGVVTFFSDVAIDYSNPDTVYLGGTTTRRSYNGFVSTNLSVVQNTRRVLTTCPSNTARLYGSGGTDLVRSDDRIATWITKSGNPGWPAGSLTLNDIKPYPFSSLEVYVAFGGYSAGNKVLRSLDGGDTWTNWSGGLPNVPTYSLAVATEGVYVGTELGVYFRGYSMTDWIPFYNDLPRTPVTSLWVNNNGLIYASTFGRGAWLSSRHSACTNLLTISGTRTGQYYFEASDAVTATITTAGTNGDEIFTQGGNSVTLNPGFEIKAGSFFKGYIAPCSNGGIPVASKSTGTEVVYLPRIRELNNGNNLPLNKENYFSVKDAVIEINLTNAAKVNMLAKQKDGTWVSFYPEIELEKGLFSLPYPNVFTSEIKILINNKPVPKL
jgi:hypothetical protein